MKKVFKGLIITISLCVSCISFGQNASISGVITDALSGEKLFSVKVVIQGLGKGATTDLDGKYAIKGLSSGAYKVEVRYNEYNNLLLDVKLKDNENFIMDLKLDKASQLGPVTLKGKVINKESTTELIRMQKNSATVVDGINAESFKRTPDSKASDVLKRISGASVQDNKFVVIRGLSDRYNFALLNGAALPSSESDRKAFSFDLFPSNMLDNLLITKTASPELPGEFAGGVININTTEPKEKNFQNIQISTAYNTLSTLKNFKTYEGTSTDFLGYGTSGRNLPNGLATTEQFDVMSSIDKAEQAKLINTSWGTKNRVALPNLSLQYTIGRSIAFKDSSKLGYVLAYSYQNNNSVNRIIRREFEEQATGVITTNDLRDSVYSNTIVSNTMANFKYSFGKKSNIQFKNLYTVNSEDKVNVRQGKRDMLGNNYNERSTNMWYTQNNLYTSQLIGSHELKNAIKVNWVLGFSSIKRDIPNLRRTVYQQTDTTQPYIAIVQYNDISTLGAGNMFWSTLTEKNSNARYDVSKIITFGKFKNEFKLGGMHQYRSRQFSARNLGFSMYDPAGPSSFNSSLLLLDPDKLFSHENMGTMADGQGGFKLEEGTNVDDSYQASSFLNAAFAQLDSKYGEKFRLVGGARIESYNQVFNYVQFGSNLPQNIDTTVVDLLPSLNLIYSLTKKINIRASYSKTVSRPEFRELAPFIFYNFVNDNLTSGDPYLKRAKMNNYDLRFEYFPGAGQIISISGFYKQFYNPIELILRTGTSGTPELYFDNVGDVINYGAEFEYRMNLGLLNKKDSSSFLKDFTLYFNGAVIRSVMDLSAIAGQAEYPNARRPLQGQSPYLINAGIFYAGPKDFNINLSYNLVGQRISIAGSVQEPSVWENGRNVIDFQVSKIIKKKFELKLNVKDILAQDLIFFQDINKNKKFDNGIDSRWQEITFGQTVSLSLKYNF